MRPILKTKEADIARCFEAAVENILDINIIPCDRAVYGSTGLLRHTHMLRAGGNYETPWTRDAAINTWNCLRLLHPEVARDTLFAVCTADEEGRPVIQPDVQTWDQIVWTVGAWSYWLATADEGFLKEAYGIVGRALRKLRASRFVERFGLFRGGSFFNDGIAGYPLDLHTPGLYDSFAPAHEAVEGIMCLSTNCLYAEAYRIYGRMAAHFGDPEAAAEAQERSEELKRAVNSTFWNEALGRYSYILYPDGHLDESQEAAGQTFAVLFDICPREKQKALLEGLTRSDRGLVSVWPPFPGLFSDDAPGRHNNLIWPFLNGMYIQALCRCGLADRAGEELAAMTKLYKDTGWHFWEIYSPYTGEPHGGWQLDHIWDSCQDQTWSASCYIGAIVHGIFGLDLGEEGISFRPCVPASMDGAVLRGIRALDMDLTLELRGHGTVLGEVLLDGTPCDGVLRPDGKANHIVLIMK